MTVDATKSDKDQGNRTIEVGKFAIAVHRTRDEAREHFGLSHRELELLVMISGGKTKKQIAEHMGVSPSTADTFRRRAYAKLGVSTGAAAASILLAYLAGTSVERTA